MVLNEPNDENCNPFETSGDRDIVSDEAEVERPTKKTRKGAQGRSVPAKHGAAEQRIAVSSSKINAHFKVGKAAIQIYEDGKSDLKSTPTTPRHRDALSKKVPITPRHRALLASNQSTPRTPKAPSTPSNSTSAVYNQARQLFSRSSNPGKLIGRDEERQELSRFVTTSLESRSGGCLYVSGPPGTGKSALVHEVLQQFGSSANLVCSTINCMSIKTTKDLSGKLCEDLGLEEGSGFEYLKSCLTKGKSKDGRKYLVILDEVDTLVDLDLELLYDLFAWSMMASSRLVLLGIANALDLTDRFLPRLKSRDLKPELLPFMPYSASQIAEVLTSKLKTLSDAVQTPFLHPTAIQFCAKKVAGQTGDLRKAFDICRKAIDLVEQETKEQDAKPAFPDSPSKTPLMENINLSSPLTPRSPAKKQTHLAYTIDTAPKATVAHVARVTSQIFGNGTMQRMAILNLQQKAVLCALSALEKRKSAVQVDRTMFATPSKRNSSAPSVKQLFDAYSGLCNRESLLHALTNTEFRDVVSGLETLGLLSAVEGKSGSFAVPITPSKTPSRRGFGTAVTGDERRIASIVARQELSNALSGPGSELLRDLLEGDVLM